MTRVFVYGSLRKGLRHHDWLHGASYVRDDVTVGRFRMLDLGAYPAVVDEPAYPIHGEVYEVREGTLSQLDQLEEHPLFFRRRVVALRSGDQAWMYLLAGKPSDHGLEGTDIGTGDYRVHLAER